MILFLFTESYPYTTGVEQNFLEVEMEYLLRSFDRVILIPLYHAGERSKTHLQVEVEDGYAKYMRSRNRLKTFLFGGFSALTYKELISRPSLLFRPAYMERLLLFSSESEMTRRWVIDWIRKQNIDLRDCLFYTYWFHHTAMGIGLARKNISNIRLVSRVHGHDLYEERRTPPYWPGRKFALQALDFLFPDSDEGTGYLQKKYPEFVSRMETARLGTPAPGFLTKASSDGVCRIVSCSRMVPVKRLDLIMKGAAVAAKRRPAQRFEWCHFGTGSLKSELEAGIKDLPGNVAVRFAGYSTQSDLFDYYRDNPVDVFMNVSVSEGTSVAIMEAISCAIPVIATAVGGNKEIVSAENGQLISANPSPDEVADALLSHWDAPGSKRSGSLAMWRERYNATQNFSDFAKRLLQICT